MQILYGLETLDVQCTEFSFPNVKCRSVISKHFHLIVRSKNNFSAFVDKSKRLWDDRII